MNGEPDHVARNRTFWNRTAHGWVESGERAWARETPVWGTWSVAEEILGVLDFDLDDKDTIELGCGTGYISSWLARRGARPVGVDVSHAQLATARELQKRHGIDFPLVLANAEKVPLPDHTFDLVISEYGASIWCNPYEWIPEAARLLRPDGRLVFLTNGIIEVMCVPEEEGLATTDRLLRPYFGMHRFEWSDDESVEFHLGHGDLIRLLRRSGFDIEDLIEVRPPAGSVTRFPYTTLEWSQRWPCEEIWKARKWG